MTEDRLMVVEAVFNGLIGEEHVTQDEVDELMELLADELFYKEMLAAQERGCSVFDGVEGDTIQ